MADGRPRPTPLLKVSGLTAGYSTTPVVQDISFTVGAGEIVALLGPNGAGKSTILKALVGTAKLLQGSVLLGEEEIATAPPHALAKKGCGYVPQSRDVFPDLTVRENLEMGGYLLAKHEIQAGIDEVTEIFEPLTAMMQRRARTLSGGERKMLAIARVMMIRPRLMILDEPTANLAPALAERLLKEHIRTVADTGAAVLLVEQKAAAALEVASWAYLLVAGRIVRSGDPDALRAQSDFAQTFLGARRPDADSGRAAAAPAPS
jgi:branched-chain amino acid transport system ATP-binding protein